VADTTGAAAPPEWVNIRHETTGGTHRCLLDAYELVWKDKGWVLVSDDEAAPDLSKLTKQQLLDLAGTRGIAVDPEATKADIVSALTEAGQPA
jgi:hypothetical protein